MAYAKFMTKKIAVDYSQETVNSVDDEPEPSPPKRDSVVFKAKQNSVISQRNQGSRASQSSRQSQGVFKNGIPLLQYAQILLNFAIFA